jgi:formylglycine-generating enzyme required for sulfatase activity
VGASITNGTNRHLIWNAKADRPDGYSATMRLRFTAVDTPPIPEGATLIPAGTFTMGRTSGDLDSNAPPVTLSVSAFYNGKYDVTKAVWDEVNSLAAACGYTDLTIGKGKAGDHPVHSITWFDMIKWCNARSQKNGLTPVYSVNGTVIKTGETAPTADWNANGYRLPTEA